jgi:AcrR family transcriptional regulator
MRRDAAANRDRLIAAAEGVFAAKGTSATLEDVARAAGVGPATLYRRFANKDALVREVLSAFFLRLIDLAEAAEEAPPEHCVDVFLNTVGAELADKAGLAADVWGVLAPHPLVEELRSRSAALLSRAQRAGAIRDAVTQSDLAAAVWAVRGVVQATRAGVGGLDDGAWKRHLDTVLRGLHT